MDYSKAVGVEYSIEGHRRLQWDTHTPFYALCTSICDHIDVHAVHT